jgi:hypothetical protein
LKNYLILGLSYEGQGSLDPESKGRMPKSQTSRPNQINQLIMENLNLHKQKMYALIVAGVGLISLFLPVSYGGFGGGSVNGLHGEGLIALLGVGGVTAAAFMGDKTKPFEGNARYIAMAGFGAMILGALIAFLSVSGKGRGVVKPGFGIWLEIIAGAVGLLFLLGIIKMPQNKPPTTPNS